MEKSKQVLIEYKFWKNLDKEIPVDDLKCAVNSEINYNDIDSMPDQIERNLQNIDPEIKSKYTKPLMHFCQGHLDDYMSYFDEIYYDTVMHSTKTGMIDYTMSGKVIFTEEDIKLNKKCDYCSETAKNRITIYGSLDIFSHFHNTDEITELTFAKDAEPLGKLPSGRNWRILSNGWGKDSVYELIHNWEDYDEIVFSDTGSEQPETIEYIKTMMKKLPLSARARITNLDAKDNPLGNLYDYYYAKKAMPTPMLRDCTGKFKINPIRRHLREKYGEEVYFDMAVCINYTEAVERMIIRMSEEKLKEYFTLPSTNQVVVAVQKQMKKHNITVHEYLVKLAKRQKVDFEEIVYRKVNEVQSGVQYMEIVYPLYDKKIHRKEEDDAIKSKGYPVPQKSGCFMCPYGTQSYYIKLENNHPDLHKKTIALIENSTMRKDVTQAKTGKLNLVDYQKNNGCGCFKGTYEEYTDEDMNRKNKW